MDSDGYYAEQSADEIFSGPTHELVPSSYSSFHHHLHHRDHRDHHHAGHHPGHHRDRRRSSSLSRVSVPISLYGSEMADDEADSGDELSRFHFFTPAEVEFAEGSSTVAGDGDDDEPLLPSHSEGYEFEEYDETDLGGSAPDDYAQVYASDRLVQRYYIAEEDMRIVAAGFSIVKWRMWTYLAMCWASLGIIYVLMRWFPRRRLQWIANPAPLGRCEFVVVENQWGELELLQISTRRYVNALSTVFSSNSSSSEGQDYEDITLPFLRLFVYRYIRFIYNPVMDMFMTNADWVSPSWGSEVTAAAGLDSETQAQREQVFGSNALDLIQPSWAKLLMDEVLHPFYVFQVFSIILWTFDDYLWYASAILIISVFSVAEALLETRSSLKRLAAVAHHAQDDELRVLRSGFWTTLPAREIVPGDVFEVSDPSLQVVPCDCVLLSGDAIVNESILTGESVPVSKLPAEEASLAAMVSEGLSAIPRSLLYGGTRVVRVRPPQEESQEWNGALALALRTGFSTTKGSLVRSMMFPKPHGFGFYRDSFRYVGVMAMVALIGFLVSAVNFVMMGLSTSLIVVRALDLITIVVPPALPATLTIGTNISLSRLRKKGVFCITPSRINVGGRLDVVCFDKTGTLTEEGLDVFGVHVADPETHKFSLLLRDPDVLRGTPLLDTLATCHELHCVDDEPIGDPLDARMFEFTKWHLDETAIKRVFTSPGANEELVVVKQFEFSSQLRRMSVVATGSQHAPSGTCVLAKGAPEVLKELCIPESLPRNFDDVLHQYTHRGYRVIACAWRPLESLPDYDRDSLEQQLIFSGLIVFENRLKPQSEPVIKALGRAGLRTIMCTGDNVLTAISVARECLIVPSGAPVYASHFGEDGLEWECVYKPQLKLNPYTLRPLGAPVDDNYVLAVTGDIFSRILQRGTTEQVEQMLLRTAVYARMSPDEKHELVLKLQQIDYTTCFCGDGANDCGALKEADVGISLSEAEASVAAPFTSRRFDVSCVLDVLAEGRCALATSFSCFKYMSLYSAIQFVTVTILYSYGSNIGDFQFLWIDLFLIVPIAVFMAWSGPANRLIRKRPGAELVSRKVLVPLLSYMVIFAAFQIVGWRLGRNQPWYIPPVLGDNDNLRSTDNTALFDVSVFQYILAGWILCEGLPYRRPVHTNRPFLISLAVTTALSLVFMFINPESGIGRLMDMTWTPLSFKFAMLLLVLANGLTLWVARRYMFEPICAFIKRAKRHLNIHKKPKRYKELEREVV